MIPTDQGSFTEEAMIEKLRYAFYVYNRERAPEISPKAWAKWLVNVPAMERRYQQERKAA